MGCAASTTASAPAQQPPAGHQAVDVAAQQQQPNARPVTMNQLQRQPPGQQQQPSANRGGNLKSAPLIQSLVDLAREKCVIESGQDGCFAKLTFSSLAAGEVIAYFNVTVAADADDGKTMPELQYSQVSRQQFSAGSSQVARLFLCEDVAALTSFTEDKGKHQLVVDLKADSSNARAITMQRSCLKVNGDHTAAQVTLQKVRCGTAVRTLEALYGTMPMPSGTESANSVGSDAEGGECVICLSKPREVTILHCRHVCLCRSCATITSSTWSFQCPVCRGRVAAMVGIEGG